MINMLLLSGVNLYSEHSDNGGLGEKMETFAISPGKHHKN